MPQSPAFIQRIIPLKKPIKKPVKKIVKKTVKTSKAKPVKRALKKSPAKKPVKKVVRKIARKLPAKKSAVKKTVKKIVKIVAVKAVRKSIKKPVKKIVAAPKAVIKKAAAPSKPMTKTAERKAARAAKAAKIAPKFKAKAIAVVKTVWPPLVEAALRCLDDAKAEDVITIDLAGKSTLADTMIVASGRSNRHVNAIADQLMFEMKKQGQHNLRVEGIPQCDWVVVDAGDILLHIFRPEVRSFYNLEKLWSAHIPE
jgi:ribosome-associated protein